MILNKDEIDRLEALSALSLSDEEKIQMLKDLNEITDFLSAIKNAKEYCCDNLQRKVEISELREDVVKPSMLADQLLANAPEHERDAFKVPKVVD